jgi:hypothetical protein
MCDFLPFLAKLAIASHGPRGTLDSPVPPSDRWLSHVSPVNRAVDRWLRTRLAHQTVWCTSNSSVNYSCGALSIFPRAACLPGRQPGHRTLSGAPQAGASLAGLSQTSPI